MSKVVGHIKGRGYFIKINITSQWKYRKPANEADNAGIRSRGGEWVRAYNGKIIFKRNLSDVPTDVVFSSDEELQSHIATSIKLQLNSKHCNIPEAVKAKIIADSKKIVGIPFNPTNCEKRVIPSKIDAWSVKQFKVVKNKSKKAIFCRLCGTVLYADEPCMQIQNVVACIHCLNTVADEIKSEYKKVPKNIKEDHLLAQLYKI